MEEEKAANLIGSQGPIAPRWQWQSDLDSLEENDPAKWTWENYSDEECTMIEQAFSLNQQEVDLTSYQIDLKRMLQVSKESRDQIRRVRRQETLIKSRSLLRDQKTMNETFGTTQQFLDFIANRTPESYQIFQRLKTLTLDARNQEFEDVIQEAINCIEKASQTREKINKRTPGSLKHDFLSVSRMIIEVIRKNSNTLDDFLKTIMKVLTMETFFSYCLNESLQNEDWEEVSVLAPYLVCLVYTFQLPNYRMKSEGPQGFVNNFIGKQKLYLYRGTALKTEHINLYNSEKVKYFSWNSITTTSRDENIAMKFIIMSLQKAKRDNESKVGVLFKIESDVASLEDCEGIIDLVKNSMTQFPDEKDVFLAPGTVFKLLKTRLTDIDIYEVSLEIFKKFKDVNENIPLLANLLDQSFFKDKAIIDRFPTKRSFKLLNLLRGNKLIRMIEIKNSGIDEHLMEEIENMRRTTQVQKQDLKIINSTFTIRSLSSLVHYFSPQSLSDTITHNKILFQEGDERLNKNLKTRLILNEEALKRFYENGQFKELWENIKKDTQATSLEVSMIKMSINNSEFKDFLQNIKEMKQLENLSLALNANFVRSTEEISNFCSTIMSLSTLKQFSIELCLSDERLKLFKKVLSSLTSLQHLSFNLKKSRKISDEGLDHLSTALQSLTCLQFLSLDFTDCYKISDSGLNYLTKTLISLTSLQYLTLNCSWCEELSNEGLDHLKTALLSMESLMSLSLDFTRCERISDEGLKDLHLGLESLKSLHYLSLNFARCFKVSDEGLSHLSAAILSLEYLQHLTLNFTKCDKISNEGLKSLNLGLKALKSLQHLSLNFNDCSRITDEGLDHLQTGLKSLSSLQHLSLSLDECFKISSEGLNSIRNAFLSLASLKHLSLDLTRCKKISDEGLNLISIGITSLKSLQHLSLNFGWCHELSDSAFNHLISLPSLRHLFLDFTWCEKITDQGFKSLASSLKSLRSLQYLSINFSYCRQISDQKLQHFKYILRLLADLRHLSLNFFGCEKITNEALYRFKDGLRSIPSLEFHQSAFD